MYSREGIYTSYEIHSTDIDECILGVANCSENANCSDLQGSYTCTCNTGFSGDGTNCSGKSFIALHGLERIASIRGQLRLYNISPDRYQ